MMHEPDQQQPPAFLWDEGRGWGEGPWTNDNDNDDDKEADDARTE